MRRQAHAALLFGGLLALPGCADSLAKRLTDETDASDQHEESASPGSAEPGEVVETKLDASS
ncbi:MAG TPA: hypothetical protein VFZ61_23915, partial [Polyangiales bacterium]